MIGLLATEAWQNALSEVLHGGAPIEIRGSKVIERIGYRSLIRMKHPAVTVEERRTPGYLRFLVGEAYWIMSGDSRVDGIRRCAPSITEFSDNGYVFQGAYGPRVVEQLSYVLDCFKKDMNTRQAVIEIWRPNPRDSKDIPCTLSLQFLYRYGAIQCVATMRSSDLWLGWPFDVFTFSMLTAWITLWLKSRYLLPSTHGDLGTLYLNAGSQHVYDRNVKVATQAAQSGRYWKYNGISLYEFNHPDDLLIHLRNLRDAKTRDLKSNFLAETLELRKEEKR